MKHGLQLVRDAGHKVSVLPPVTITNARDWWAVEPIRRMENLFSGVAARSERYLEDISSGEVEALPAHTLRRMVPIWHVRARRGEGVPYICLHRLPAGAVLTQHKGGLKRYVHEETCDRLMRDATLVCRCDDPAKIARPGAAIRPIFLLFDGEAIRRWKAGEEFE